MDERIIKETGKLGFGLMRLPHKGPGIDIEQTSKMVDMFLEAGGTYFDTAHVYPGSEAAAKKALDASRLRPLKRVRSQAGSRATATPPSMWACWSWA